MTGNIRNNSAPVRVCQRYLVYLYICRGGVGREYYTRTVCEHIDVTYICTVVCYLEI